MPISLSNRRPMAFLCLDLTEMQSGALDLNTRSAGEQAAEFFRRRFEHTLQVIKMAACLDSIFFFLRLLSSHCR